MNRIMLFSFVLSFVFHFDLPGQQLDNIEIRKMYEDDQNARKTGQIDWTRLNREDKMRAVRMYQLIDSGRVVTGKDYYHSAMIFQHGQDTVASGMAIKLMRKAVALDTTVNRWLLAAAIDRDLMRKGQPQIYGTQYVKMGPNAKFERYKIDTTLVTDKERRYYRVETLAEQLEKDRNMNLLPVSKLYTGESALNTILELIKAEKERGRNAEYNVSEQGINSFGYTLIKKPEEALKIFKLNTELYPTGFNAFDSYGECLLLLNRKKEAIEAYQKSLELNPKNTNAARILSSLK